MARGRDHSEEGGGGKNRVLCPLQRVYVTPSPLRTHAHTHTQTKSLSCSRANPSLFSPRETLCESLEHKFTSIGISYEHSMQ